MTPVGAEQAGASRDSAISLGVVRALMQAVEQAGVDRTTFMTAARLEPALLAAPDARSTRAEVYGLCELAVQLSGDEGFGLHWAERLSEPMFVPVSHLLCHCASLRQAFELLARFFRLLGDDPGYRIVEREEHVILHCLPIPEEPPRIQRFVAEMMVGGFWQLVRTYNAQARPERASFAHPAPAYHGDYQRLFEGAQCFGQPFTGIVFARELLNVPSLKKDDDVRDALHAVAERRLLRLTQRTPYSQRVRDHLVRHGWPDRTDMESVARSLEVSVRSLRRRLSDEGKPYNEVLNEALAIVAKQLLQDPRRTIQEIAYQMGFADPSAFHRAFKRWTGMTPTVFREEQLKHAGQ
jgi:AraC-like DNA-binding protein